MSQSYYNKVIMCTRCRVISNTHASNYSCFHIGCSTEIAWFKRSYDMSSLFTQGGQELRLSSLSTLQLIEFLSNIAYRIDYYTGERHGT